MLAGQLTVTVDVALVILQVPVTAVIVKFVSVPPVTVGVTVPEPTAGPTVAGLLVQLNIPAIVATGCPKRRENTNSLIFGLRLISSRITPSVLSGEGSREKIIS